MRNFYGHSFMMAQRLSEPQIVLRGKGRDGQPMLVNDFIGFVLFLFLSFSEDTEH